MNIEIENISFYKIAYIRKIGAYGQNNVQIMAKLKRWAKSNRLLNEQSIILGIAHDNPKLKIVVMTHVLLFQMIIVLVRVAFLEENM